MKITGTTNKGLEYKRWKGWNDWYQILVGLMGLFFWIFCYYSPAALWIVGTSIHKLLWSSKQEKCLEKDQFN